MIPKIIHRVWISDDLPDPNTDIGKCFYSQEKLKDYGYEIRTYTAKNFDFSISKYLLQAYSLKKWAFATDYIRLWALFTFILNHEFGTEFLVNDTFPLPSETLVPSPSVSSVI